MGLPKLSLNSRGGILDLFESRAEGRLGIVSYFIPDGFKSESVSWC